LFATPRPCNDYSCYGALEIVGAITIINDSAAPQLTDFSLMLFVVVFIERCLLHQL